MAQELSGRQGISVAGARSGSSHLAKDVLDVVVASTTLVLASPLMLLAALAIKLDSPGPIFFRQRRVGARRVVVDGEERWTIRHFEVIKFRSMRTDTADELHRQHIREFVEGRNGSDGGGDGKKLENDPRITRVGRLIRRTSLDELPQLFNVLRREMSLVGPRPVPLYEYEAYEEWHKERLNALPGITGLWQVYGRGRVTFEEMIRLDIRYVRHRSIWLDLKLLAMTIPAVLKGTGAG